MFIFRRRGNTTLHGTSRILMHHDVYVCVLYVKQLLLSRVMGGPVGRCMHPQVRRFIKAAERRPVLVALVALIILVCVWIPAMSTPRLISSFGKSISYRTMDEAGTLLTIEPKEWGGLPSPTAITASVWVRMDRPPPRDDIEHCLLSHGKP